MKKFGILLVLTCSILFVGCNKEDNLAENLTTSESEVESVIDSIEEESIEEVEEDIFNTEITHIPFVDLESLDSSEYILNIGFEEKDIYTYDGTYISIDATVYDYQKYNKEDIENLEVGQSLKIRDSVVLITSKNVTEFGVVELNCSDEQDGYYLILDGDYYHEVLDNGRKYFYEIGVKTFNFANRFEFYDNIDSEKEVTYDVFDFLIEGSPLIYFFTPQNTSIKIVDNEVVSMNRIFIP